MTKKVLFIYSKENSHQKSGGNFRRSQNKKIFKKYFGEVDSLEIVIRSPIKRWHEFRQKCKEYDILVLEEPKYIFYY